LGYYNLGANAVYVVAVIAFSVLHEPMNIGLKSRELLIKVTGKSQVIND